jgi:hypothetical protein
VVREERKVSGTLYRDGIKIEGRHGKRSWNGRSYRGRSEGGIEAQGTHTSLVRTRGYPTLPRRQSDTRTATHRVSFTITSYTASLLTFSLAPQRNKADLALHLLSRRNASNSGGIPPHLCRGDRFSLYCMPLGHSLILFLGSEARLSKK